jgi:hypothetical protein
MADDTPLSSPLAGGSTANALAPSYYDRAKAMLTGSGPIQTSKGVSFTPEDIDRAVNMGMAFSGGGLSTAERAGIKAYHGSPHSFERFSSEKIGTGERAQAYGHGLYFAEEPNVAKGYQTTLGRDPTAFNVNGKIVEQPSPEFAAASLVHKFQDIPANIASRLPDEPAYADIKKVLVGWKDNPPKITPGRGHMYEVNIKAEPEHFLDWDRPLHQQPQKVQDLVKSLGIDKDYLNMLRPFHGNEGSLVYKALENKLLEKNLGSNPDPLALPAAQQMVLRQLSEAGIPGVRYLDQSSRAAGKGTSNYVVFDDKTIDIIKKYGLAGLIGGPAMVNVANQANTQK